MGEDQTKTDGKGPASRRRHGKGCRARGRMRAPVAREDTMTEKALFNVTGGIGLASQTQRLVYLKS